MLLGRVTGVRGPGGPGSGYALGGRLVLTSAHVVGAVGSEASVFLAGRPGVFAASVVWRGDPRGRDDAALLRVADAAWVPPAGAAVRWGRTVTHRPGIECVTCGFPDVVQAPERDAEMLQPSGVLNPGDLYVGDRYLVRLSPPVPSARADGGSPWGGLSGAALFCGDLLVGVIAADPAGFGHGALAAVPAYVLHRSSGFLTALARYGPKAAPVLEPVEWPRLADTGEVAGGLTGSPAELLRARREVVPFRGRAALMRRLREWASGAAGHGVWLLHGPGGQGKTRVAAELAKELAEAGWAVVWLDRDAADVAGLRDAAAPLLVVVDYAETRPRQLAAVVDAIVRHGGASPIRLLLLARTAGSWWQEAQEASTAAEALLTSAAVTALEPVDTDLAGRRFAYRQAVRAFAAVLPDVPGSRDVDWDALAAGLRDSAPAHGTVTELTVQMRALADLLDAAHPSGRDATGRDTTGWEPDGVEDRLLVHERRYWRNAANARNLDTALSWATLTESVAAGLLAGAANRDEADVVLRAVPALADQPRDRRHTVRDWIASLYPPPSGRLWGTLLPDRLAERFIGRHLRTDPGLAASLVRQCTPDQAAQLLTIYARAAAHSVFSGDLDGDLIALCVDHPAELAVTAAHVATWVERADPLVRALYRITDDPGTPIEYLSTLSDHLPRPSQVLAEYAVHLSRRLTDFHRVHAAHDPGAHLPDLALSLNNQSLRLADLGLWDEALEAVSEAVAVRRGLAEAEPDAFLPGLADSLNNQSVHLANLGRREEALEAATQAVAIQRGLPQARPDLARSLMNQSSHLAGMGRREEALDAITQAVTICKGLARTQAEYPDLAMALNNRSVHLTGLGRLDEALEAITEAVAAYQDLAEAQPDAFLPDLAMALNNRSVHLANLDRGDEALDAISQAIAIRSDLAEARPDAFLPALAESLNNQSAYLSGLERHEEALEAITRAVAIRSDLAEARPDAFLPALAGSLSNQSVHLANQGRREEALEAVTQAVTAYQDLAEAQPDAFLPDLAMSLNNQSSHLANLGRGEEGLKAATRAVDIYRELAEARPAAFLPDLATALRTRSIRLRELGRPREAQETLAQSDAIRRLIR